MEQGEGKDEHTNELHRHSYKGILCRTKLAPTIYYACSKRSMGGANLAHVVRFASLSLEDLYFSAMDVGSDFGSPADPRLRSRPPHPGPGFLPPSRPLHPFQPPIPRHPGHPAPHPGPPQASPPFMPSHNSSFFPPYWGTTPPNSVQRPNLYRRARASNQKTSGDAAFAPYPLPPSTLSWRPHPLPFPGSPVYRPHLTYSPIVQSPTQPMGVAHFRLPIVPSYHVQGGVAPHVRDTPSAQGQLTGDPYIAEWLKKVGEYKPESTKVQMKVGTI